jgi:hypothetical protein
LNPALGRFMTADSFGGDQHSPLSLNRYIYTAQDPVNLIDPTGHQFDLISAVVALSVLSVGAEVGISIVTGNPIRTPDAGIQGISFTAPFEVVGSALATFFLAGLTFGAAGAGVEVTNFLSNKAGSRFASLSITVGLELVSTDTDRKVGLYFYSGVAANVSPVIGLPGGSVGGTGPSLSVYFANCWDVPTVDSYGGPFVSVSANIGFFGLGTFFSPNNPQQHGYLLSLNPRATGFGVAGAYTEYTYEKTLFEGKWAVLPGLLFSPLPWNVFMIFKDFTSVDLFNP